MNPANLPEGTPVRIHPAPVEGTIRVGVSGARLVVYVNAYGDKRVLPVRAGDEVRVVADQERAS